MTQGEAMSTPLATHAGPGPLAPPDVVLLRHIIAEYREMPGLCLTHAQACRLFNLAPDVCAGVMGILVDQGLLKEISRGRLILADRCVCADTQALTIGPARRLP